MNTRLDTTPTPVSIPIAPGPGVTRKKQSSRFETGVKMSGLSKFSRLSVGKDDLCLFFESSTASAYERLGEYFVASNLISASATPFEPLNELAEHRFFDGWIKKPINIGDDPHVGVVLFDRTETVEELRPEIRIIDWDAEVVIPRQSPPPRRARSHAFRAFSELRTWLRLSVPEAADLIRVGRTTPVTSWEKKQHEPQPKTARRLYQLHALVGSVVRQLGHEGAYEWLGAGPRLSLMEADDIRAFADEVERLTIRHPARTGPLPGSDIAPPEGAVAVAPGGRRRRAPARRRQ